MIVFMHVPVLLHYVLGQNIRFNEERQGEGERARIREKDGRGKLSVFLLGEGCRCGMS